jgi:hypothetical protein
MHDLTDALVDAVYGTVDCEASLLRYFVSHYSLLVNDYILQSLSLRYET